MAANQNEPMSGFADDSRSSPTGAYGFQDFARGLAWLFDEHHDEWHTRCERLHVRLAGNLNTDKAQATHELVCALLGDAQDRRLQSEENISRLPEDKQKTARLLLCFFLTPMLDKWHLFPRRASGGASGGRFTVGRTESANRLVLESECLLTPHGEGDRRLLREAVGEEERDGGWQIGKIVEALWRTAEVRAAPRMNV